MIKEAKYKNLNSWKSHREEYKKTEKKSGRVRRTQRSTSS